MGISIGIFAHVDAGKTTLSEQILYKCGILRSFGRVDNRNTLLDSNEIEKRRGITIFADEASFKIRDKEFYLIDTPGHTDFAGEMERSLIAIDYAILVISAVEGIEAHTSTIWSILKERKVPTIIFINKSDRDIANTDKVMQQIKDKFSSNALSFDSFSGKIGGALLEEAAMLDEELLAKYLENSEKSFDFEISELIRTRHLFPMVSGSALSDIGVDTLLSILYTYANIKQINDDKFSAVVYKVRHDRSSGRITYLKVLSGKLLPKAEIATIDKNGEATFQKVNEIRSYSGNKFTPKAQAIRGDLSAVLGLFEVKPGDIVGEGAKSKNDFYVIPLMRVKVSYDPQIPVLEMLKILRELEDEEPLLGVEYNERLKEIHINILGEIQLEIIGEILATRYCVNVVFGECEILYKETITSSVQGCGHFEPLRHYAEVHFEINPAKRGSGITFKSICSTDELSQSYQNLIKTHVFEKQHLGVLIGSPLTDVEIVLTSGRAHLKHTEGGDFREAVYRGIRQGLMNAEGIILEPWFSYAIEVENQLVGKVLCDIQGMGGKYEIPKSTGDISIITGLCPVATMQSYPKDLQSASKGQGKINMSYGGYYPVTNQEEIIKKKGYSPESDLENTPDSVFCSHGAGFCVKWYDVEKFMHIK